MPSYCSRVRPGTRFWTRTVMSDSFMGDCRPGGRIPRTVPAQPKPTPVAAAATGLSGAPWGCLRQDLPSETYSVGPWKTHGIASRASRNSFEVVEQRRDWQVFGYH